jgi:glycosyltransferase involved in cell wall biosynthesis
VPDAEYTSLVAASRALVYFSEYEGFGMPPIESILFGTAPVYSSIPAMHESGLGFGFPFVNGSSQSFASAINHAIQCPQDTLQNWAADLLKHHNWENVARRIVHNLNCAGNNTNLVKGPDSK